ncbi:uncharacterized protein LOC142332177 [Lycorma delicatula]|uniref:uncharacterized protein LOC142332177 n=1 Tax=Lycorma delicatula TaxID=130591 RepID=UPI003F517A7F
MPAPDQPSRSNVCRRLFFSEEDEQRFPAGHEDNAANSLLEIIRRDNQRAREKWNFDFETETPLEGRWEWTEVLPGSEINVTRNLSGSVDNNNPATATTAVIIPVSSSSSSLSSTLSADEINNDESHKMTDCGELKPSRSASSS